MTNIRRVREQLAVALDGLGFTPYNVLPANAELPAAVVGWPDEIAYHRDGDDGTEVTLAVTIAVPSLDWEAAQAALDAVVDPTGPPAALEAHVTDVWHQAVVTIADNIRPLDDPPCLAVDLNLTIYPTT